MVVLLVEDDALIAMAVAFELEAAGHTVVGPAIDERSALSLASEHHPDVALVDIDLGNGDDGLKVAQSLTAVGVPPVFASAECAAARAGCNAVALLGKPYAPEAAVRSLEAVVAVLKGGRASGAPELEWLAGWRGLIAH